MSNYTRGIADAMLESRASGAESAAAFAAADAAHARRMLHDSEMSADRQAEEWRNYANKLLDTVYERTAEVSAAMVVIDSVIKDGIGAAARAARAASPSCCPQGARSIGRA